MDAEGGRSMRWLAMDSIAWGVFRQMLQWLGVACLVVVLLWLVTGNCRAQVSTMPACKWVQQCEVVDGKWVCHREPVCP